MAISASEQRNAAVGSVFMQETDFFITLRMTIRKGIKLTHCTPIDIIIV